MLKLEKQLLNSINEQGALTFEAYMQQCLYHEDYGYYANNQAEIGKSGDFSTSISIGCLFGQLLAERIHQLWLTLPEPQQAWSIFEIGAFHGQLALDILNHLQITYPNCYKTCNYTIFEPFAKLQEHQQSTLHEHSIVNWIQETQHTTNQAKQGIILSNELFDALAVERLIYQNQKWQLIGINSLDNQLVQNTLSISSSPYASDIKSYLLNIDFKPTEGYELEFNPHINSMCQNMSSLIQDGHQLHIDYGFAQSELLHPERNQGTLQAYHQHKVVTNYLSMSGQTDLSCHINFTENRKRRICNAISE